MKLLMNKQKIVTLKSALKCKCKKLVIFIQNNLNHVIFRVESHLKMANFELNKKLEEKTNVIKDLSNQLSVHESNFKEVKNELKQVIFHL